MRLEEALVAVLNNASPVTAIVEDRIQHGESAPEWQSLPDVFFECDHSGYTETFSQELNERRLQFVTLRVTARALSSAVAMQAVAASADAIRDASGTSITSGDETSIAIENVQTEDPGSSGGSEEITQAGTTTTIYYHVARFHVAYYDDRAPGEDADDDGESGSTPSPTRTRAYRSDGSIDGPQTAPVEITHSLGVKLLAGFQCYVDDVPIGIPWHPVDTTTLHLDADIPAGVTVAWVAMG